ncbi:MAG: divalent-cation tolerance protein CutA [Candidatus Omnitrophica bacterium]|nr:divalent-cation tolerance protein CutA [Candidatus Omnitrophota bacterium]
MHEFIMVLTTFKDANQAALMARVLVEKKLAACCNILKDVHSVYMWEGELQDQSEALMLIKTKSSLFHALESEIKSLHSYATPEIVVLPIVEGSDAYLHWVEQSTL